MSSYLSKFMREMYYISIVFYVNIWYCDVMCVMIQRSFNIKSYFINLNKILQKYTLMTARCRKHKI